MELKILVFNIEYGGDDTTDHVIKTLGADVVGVLESYNRLPEIAKNTGYPYYNTGLQILSKFPIHEPSGADGLYSLIEVQPGYVVAFFNVHLDYVRLGPQLLAEGVPLDEVMASENAVRTSSIRILIPYLQKLCEAGYPVFLTGDFNEPSSLDYGQETVGTRQGISQPVPWPVSEALFGIGMRDTFREIHPDPVRVPAVTHEDGDRIDYVYAGGPVAILDSALVGAPGGPDVDLSFDPWTSDHRAVLSSFRLQPVKLPTTVSLDRRLLTVGEKLGVSYNAPGQDRNSIAITSEDRDAPPAIEIASTNESGVITIDTNLLGPGGYGITMLDAQGNELARNGFWLRSAAAKLVIETGKSVYKVGEPIDVSWSNGPANRWDWIAVYRKSTFDPTEDGFLLWAYTGGHDAGTLPPQAFGKMTLGENSQGGPWPLPEGEYRIHYLLTDQYKSAGYINLTVRN